MDFILNLVNIFLHLDEYLGEVIRNYGVWTYLILFLIILETGLVVTPVFTGDSLLCGWYLCWIGRFEHRIFVLPDGVGCCNRRCGEIIGSGISSVACLQWRIRFLKRIMDRTHAFEKHGGKTIILARFVPIVRTFALCRRCGEMVRQIHQLQCRRQDHGLLYSPF
jgi:membrane-associated protein